MKTSLRSVLLTLSIAVAAVPGHAQTLATWVNGCDAVGQPDLLELLEDSALLVPPQALVPNGGGTYQLQHEPFTQIHFGGPGYALCAGQPFYEEPRVVYSLPSGTVTFRSVVQVGPDLVLTAWHLPVVPPSAIVGGRVVFGVYAREVGGVCQAPDFEAIPAAQVYEITEVVADGNVNPGGVDFLLLRLDRVVDQSYPRVRRSGWGIKGDAATIVSHYERTAAKVDLAGQLGGLRNDFHGGYQAVRLQDVHTGDGSSGGMVYNRTQRILETLVARSPIGVDYELQAGQGCYDMVSLETNEPTNVSLRYFAANIPPFELQVNSLDEVVHVAAVGGALGNASSTRRISAPSTASGPIDYEIVPPPGPTAGQPTLAITPGGPLLGTLAPGSIMAVQQSASANGVSCGTYERSYRVRDLTHGFEDVARHRFEIGVTEFTVSADPSERAHFDVAIPFEDIEVYTVTNPRPTPVTVQVTADAGWILLNGLPSVTLNLPPGANGLVTVAANESAPPTPYVTHKAHVTFAAAPASPCLATPPIVREFGLLWGREDFRVPLAEALPATVNLGVDETFCIGDIDVNLKVSGVPANQLRIDLTSPGGTTKRIWDQQDPLPSGFPLDGWLDEGVLNDFEGLKGGGVWTLSVTDQALPVQGTATDVTLSFTACP